MVGWQSELLKPLAVAAGARRGGGVACSAAQAERVERGLKRCAGWGLTPQLASTALERGPLYFAGTAEQRLTICIMRLRTTRSARDLHCAAATARIICWKDLDLDLIAESAKPFFAYSDLTGAATAAADEVQTAGVSRADAGSGFFRAKMACTAELSGGAGGAALQRGRGGRIARRCSTGAREGCSMAAA